jgi:hypothetical protein
MQRPLHDKTQHSQETGFHAPAGIRAHNPRKTAAADPHLKEKSEPNNENKTFLLSVVLYQDLKNLNHDQKYWAQMEILGIMRKLKKYGVSVTVCAVFYRNDFFTTDI